MARIIEFYIPENHQPKPVVMSITRGKVIEFHTTPNKRSA
jgi:hypothetical protein